MRAITEGALIIVPTSVHDYLGDVVTAEFRVPRDFLDKVPRKPSSPPHVITEPGIQFSRDSLVIFSKSTSTLTIRAPRWKVFSILALVEKIEKGELGQKSKLKK